MTDRGMTEAEHKEWLAQNRHLLSYGHILALGEQLTAEENEKLDAWYEGQRPND